MEDLLFYKDIYDPFKYHILKLADKSKGDWKKINQKTIGVIWQRIDQFV